MTKPWFVRDAELSERLDLCDRQVFMRVCPEKRYARGEAIFRVGDPATSLHVIAEGQVKLVTAAPGGHERILAICGPNDFIGEAFLQEAQVYRVDAVALTSAITCPMSREQFLELALRAPTFTLSFAEILANHLFRSREQLSSTYDPIKQRLVRAAHRAASRRTGVDGQRHSGFGLHRLCRAACARLCRGESGSLPNSCAEFAGLSLTADIPVMKMQKPAEAGLEGCSGSLDGTGPPDTRLEVAGGNLF